MKDLSSTAVTLGDISTYQAGVLQSATQRSIKKFTDNCLKEYGLSTMQWFVIGTIYAAGEAGMRVGQLSRLLGTNLPYITNMLNVLESMSIIERQEVNDDGRSKRIRLTPAYNTKCPQIEIDLRQKLRAGIYSRVRPDQLRTYLQVLQQLNQVSN